MIICFRRHAGRDREQHREKLERLHKRISNVDNPRNKTPSVSCQNGQSKLFDARKKTDMKN